MIEFYNTKEEKGIYQLLIKTDAEKEDNFIHSFSDLLVSTISAVKDEDEDVGLFIIDWPFLLRNFAEIVCKFRGYKASVIQRTITVSSGAMPTSEPSMKLNDKGQFFKIVEKPVKGFKAKEVKLK